VLARGLAYVGPDFRLEPPTLAPFRLPSLGIVGTGKRVGKTAVANHAARLLARRHDVVVVAMGRGGPREPQLVVNPPSATDLLALARAGFHAASDYLEDAVLAGVPSVGARRCGGGLAGRPAASNVERAAELAAEQAPDLVLFEGSGAALPPIATDRRVVVVSAGQEPDVATGYLNTYRVLVSDLVIVAGAEADGTHAALVQALAEVVNPHAVIVACALRPRPVTPVAGRRAVLFTTAMPAAHRAIVEHLGDAHGSDVVHVSGNLSRRDDLRRELDALPSADVWLTEVKAAAIDVVAEAAAARSVAVVFVDNEVLPLPGEPDLDAELVRLAEEAMAARAVAV
jgi:cyclic 2,3-diphosphoglycerate synthase